MNQPNGYNQFRERFPRFKYLDFSYTVSATSLKVVYTFAIGNTYSFYPKIQFHGDARKLLLVNKELLESMLFHIGLTEMISYWKTTCSPTIEIYPFALSNEQQEWFKKLIYNGLGEFFYINNIKPDPSSLVTFENHSSEYLQKQQINLDEGYLVPVGGGKDSALTLELLPSEVIMPMIMNPRKAQIDTLIAAGFNNNQFMNVTRTLDPTILEMNSQGFLNGHTPFSALLAFITLPVAVLSNRKNIALSNESSANESTVPGSDINHQYSKSIEFENDFRRYINTFITGDIRYFSFLRPLSELQISGLFSKLTAHHLGFRSCNAGSKTNSWCGKCPKCMFTYIMLSAFLPQSRMEQIFGINMFENADMIPFMEELTGIRAVKPFECVGTIEEVNLALAHIINYSYGKNLPVVLQHYTEKIKIIAPEEILLKKELSDLNHNLTSEEVEILYRYLNEFSH